MKSLPLSVLAQIVGSGPIEGSDHSVAGVSTDTRTIKTGDCFFAIAGGNFDGHNYVHEAFAKGATCAVVERAVEGLGTGEQPVLKVPDTIRALGDLARAYRQVNSLKVVAITGSVGKTTTRQIVHHVLSQHFRVHQASKSFNNNIGLPLTLLGAEPDTQIVVAELGANHPGEIAYLTRIAQPDVALVTNAHPAHLEGFGDLATIVREKLSIAEGLSEDGVLIVNGDIEPLVATCRGGQGHSARSANRPPWIIGPSTSPAKPCTARSLSAARQVRLPLPGPGNVENALAAWAVCDQFGVTVAPSPRLSKTSPASPCGPRPCRSAA